MLHIQPIPRPYDERVVVAESAEPDYGLHHLDINIAYGNLIDLVGTPGGGLPATRVTALSEEGPSDRPHTC